MPDYTFHQLSNYDFEVLTRDLLQKELNVTLESFTSGKDRGIDLRYSPASNEDTIVQCKHYAKSDFSSLIRAVKEEVPKVENLNPSRYIFATSKGLTPPNKDKILNTLSPYCTSVSDIYGRDDINNLLGKYPDIERKHYKLWLTSTNILERIIHSGIFGASNAEIEHIKNRINRYVTNPSLTRANKILDNDQFCVIAGLPGIGKTTLAQMLLMGYFHDGYDCYRVWENISEAYEVFEPSKKQVFYFDDFLGKTGLKTKFNKNEDERLLRFIKDITRTENSKLILTTREYILNQAMWVYEALKRINLDASQCVIELEDYTDFIKAQILYNHLYFSELPKPYLLEIVSQKVYRKIIEHQNYNPRIIEIMTELINVRDCDPKDYPTEFIDNLDDPYKIWEVAFNNHLSKEAANILLVLSTLPDITNYEVLKETFEKFHFYRAEKYNRETDPYDFKRGLKELENNFIEISSNESELVVEYHNPSVRDFVENVIRSSQNDADELLNSSIYPNQILKLWEINEKRREDEEWAVKILKQYQDKILIDPPQRYWKLSRGEYYKTRPTSYINRFIHLCNISLNAEKITAEKIVKKEIEKAVDQIFENGISMKEGLNVLNQILEGDVLGEDSEGEFFRFIYEQLFSDIFSLELMLDDFDDLRKFAEIHGDVISDEIYHELEQVFQYVAEEEIMHSLENDEMEEAGSLYDDASYIAKKLNFYFQFDTELLGNPYHDFVPESTTRIRHSATESDSTNTTKRIDRLFDSLIE